MNYEKYEEQCKLRCEENEHYLTLFEETLEKTGLSDKTIAKHLSNVEFYLNTYLLREDALPMVEGCYRADDFLGNFFIRKCMWSTPSSVKSTAASFKKFYSCMRDHGKIQNEDYEILVESIRDGMEFWLDDCEVYNNPEADNPFSPF